MKKSLSLILAALMLASSLASCVGTTPKETEAETKAPETNAVETNSPETNAPVAEIDNSTVTENGIAKAHIVLAENAEYLEEYAAEELVYHIKKVSGADISVVNAVQENSLPIFIGTPDTIPALSDLFPEDIEWLTTLLDEDGRNWGNDGFAIRQTEDALYIFGATPRGALNGVHDFIEDNMGVLWVRADEEIGLIYDEMPTITITKANYREKSPFAYRGTTFGNASFEETRVLYVRNKLNNDSGYSSEKFRKENGVWIVNNSPIIEQDFLGHTMKIWIYNSPIYDPNCTEYWVVDEFGNPVPNETNQINFWSERTFDTVVAAMLELLSQHPDLKTIPLSIEDGLLEKEHLNCPPYSEQPYEYAPGQFVEPGDKAFRSTVVFSFINKVAKRIAEDYPNVTVLTYAYHDAITPPHCEIEPNVCPVFTPIEECMADPITDPANPHNAIVKNLIDRWGERPNKLGVYEYYFCYFALADYERPLWYKMQSDLQLYAEKGFTHFISQGVADGGSEHKDAIHYFTQRTHSDVWSMNALSNWLFAKLTWNPYEDVDALIEYYCDKVYGAASEYMKEYYALIYKGWIEGESEALLWNFKPTTHFYLDTFVYIPAIEEDIIATLRNAYDTCDTIAKEQIRYVKETYEKNFPDVE